MVRFLSGALTGCLFFSFSIDAAYAQDLDYFTLSPHELLKAEVISVSRKTERVADAPAAIYVITQEDIRRSGVTSIPEALRLAPGVQVARADSNSWAISIRGFNSLMSNKLLVMIDGRSVYNPLFAGTYWELQDYMLEDIERIEVVRGPGGAVWGANAVNGVINIITQKAKDTQGNLVSALYGTEEKGTVSARHGGSFGDEFSDNAYRVYAKYFSRDSFITPGGEDAHDEWRGGKSGFRMDWGDRFTLQGDIYRVLTDQRNLTPAVPLSFIEEETMESQGANLLGRWTQEMDDGALFNMQAYFDYTGRDQILLKDQRHVFDWEAQYNFAQRGRHDLIAGAGYRYMQDDLGSGPSIIEFSPTRRRDNLFSFFMQDKIELAAQRWYLTLGSKFEHNDYTGFEAQPNVRLQYHPDSDQMIWAAISRAVRTPSRLEHDLNYRLAAMPGTTIVLESNPDFRSETLVAYEAGYRNQINRDLSVDIAVFYNDYEDLATFGFLTPSPGIFPIETVNGMTAETYGIEISSSWNVTENFKLSGSYSFLDMFLHVPENGGYDLETAERVSPHHQANIRASWNVTERVSFDAAAYYVDQLSQPDVKDYIRMDLNLGWKIDDNVRFNLTGQNLLQESHREFSSPTALNAAEVERAVFGKVTWQF